MKKKLPLLEILKKRIKRDEEFISNREWIRRREEKQDREITRLALSGKLKLY